MNDRPPLPDGHEPGSFVVAIIATYNRPREVAELLEVLAGTAGLGAVVIADNGADSHVRALTEQARVPAEYLPLESNEGPGRARNRAMAFAREKWGPVLSHYWILDDDVRFAPDTLQRLLAALSANHAQLVAPLIIAPSGEVFTWPELKHRAARRWFARRDRKDPAQFATGIEADQLPEISACTAVCYLMDRACGEQLQIREDFWLLGGDVEHTARIAQKFRAVFCPHVLVEHFWGTPLERDNVGRSNYFKACAALQNNLYMLSHVLRTHFILRSFLGALKRFVLLHLRSRASVYDFCSIVWNACVRAEPAGARSGRLLRERRQTYQPR